jgi:uncharacterized membrane protein
MTMAVASTVAVGTYNITVTGTAGSTKETTIVSLVVSAASGGSFTLKAAPTKVSVAPGGHGTSKITAAPSGGFKSAIALSASGMPTGVTVTFKPTSIANGSGSSTATITVSKTAKAGTSTITVTGTGGGVTKTVKITLTIT